MAIKNLSVRWYQESDKKSWDSFINESTQATFLLNRDYMDYHKDRFSDASILVMKGESIAAVIPAHRVNDVLASHDGLTYGGIVYDRERPVHYQEQVFVAVLAFAKAEKIKTLRLKLIPSIYRAADSTFEYLMFKHKATLYQRELNMIIDVEKDFNRNAKKNRIQSSTLELRINTDFKSYWEQVLTHTLDSRHGVAPVHTLYEIEQLATATSNIKMYNCYEGNRLVAGVCVFEKNGILKSQYAASTPHGMELAAMDFIYLSMIEMQRENGNRYIDMGTVNGDAGYSYNSGLTRFKEELGAYPINLDRYQLDL